MDSELIQLVQTHGYWVMFILMAVEGPMIGAISGFLASLGMFNPWMVFLMFVLGDVIPDGTYYWIGYFSRDTILPKVIRFFKIKPETVERAQRYIRRNEITALAIFKYTPFIAVTGLILSGASKIPFKKFFAWDVVLAVPNAMFFVGSGYLLGAAAGPMLKSVQNIQQGILIAVVALGVLYVIIRSLRNFVSIKAGEIIGR